MTYIEKTMGRGETPITISRRHIIVLVGYAIKWFGLFLIALIVALWLVANWHDNDSTIIADKNLSTVKTVVVLALFALALVAMIAMVANYIRWYNEVYVLTNRRVIRILGIFNKDELDSSLDKLNDTKEHQSFWGRILGYGTLEILTASQDGIDQLDYVPNPLQFRKAIQDAKNGYYNQNQPPVAQPVNPNYNPNINNYNGPANTGVYDRNGYNNYPQPTPPQRGPVNYQQPISDPMAASTQIKPQDVPALIQQLAKLRDAGVITEAEFQAKKNDLFSRM